MVTATPFISYASFIYTNADRYLDFSQKNPSLSNEDVITYVNIGLDRNFYEDVHIIENPLEITTLVNTFNRLASDFEPFDLVDLDGGQFLREEAADAFLALEQALYETEGLRLTRRSAYRSYDSQLSLFESNVNNLGLEEATRWSARPGHSEHQLGLAIDIIHQMDTWTNLSDTGFDQTPQYRWLLNNAHEFGFILRYPQAFEHVTGFSYEPWHWRYVGTELATYLVENNIPTLEHYFATLETNNQTIEFLSAEITPTDGEDGLVEYAATSIEDMTTDNTPADSPRLLPWPVVIFILIFVPFATLVAIRYVNLVKRRKRRQKRRQAQRNVRRH